MKHAKEIHAWADGAVIQFRHTPDYPWFDCTNNKPEWVDHIEYRASLAIVEGKPVFEGDVIFNRNGIEFIASHIEKNSTGALVNKNGSIGNLAEKCSWNPPAPNTVMVELLVEDAERCANQSYYFAGIAEACRKALKSE